jgi:hypothetical protein
MISIRDLDPYAKAIIGAAVVAASAYAASTAAHHTLAQVGVETGTAFVVALAAAWALPGAPLVKELASGLVAGGAAFLASYGHVSNAQTWIATIIALVVGTGFVSLTSNTGHKPVSAQ